MPYLAIDPTIAQAAPVGTATLGAPKTNWGKTLGEMSLELAAQLAGRTDVIPTRLDTWINDAYLDVCSSLDLPQLLASFSIDLTADQPFYLLPEAVEFTRMVSVIDSSTYSYDEGRQLTKSDLETYRTQPVKSDEPTQYFREGDVLVLYPTPKNVRTIAVDVKIQPMPMSDPEHSPFIPKQWHEVILKAARAKAFSALLEFDLAAQADNEWISLVRRKQDPIAEEDGNRVIRSSVPHLSKGLYRSRRG